MSLGGGRSCAPRRRRRGRGREYVVGRVWAQAAVPPWIEIRLGRRAPEPIAARLGVNVDALRMQLARADERLVAALERASLSDLVSHEAGKELAGRAHPRDRSRAGAPATTP
jgi:hypothetical protein